MTKPIREFLEENITHDENTGNRIAARTKPKDSKWSGIMFSTNPDSCRWTRGTVTPQRILAEVKAKREILALHEVGSKDSESLADYDFCIGCSEVDLCLYIPAEECYNLFALAAIYADRPDYNPAWKPED